MSKIVNSKNAPHLTLRFRKWVESEWGNVDSFESPENGVIFPAPILALEHQELVGGLSFTSHVIPDSKALGVWINTLYVAPEYRNYGIGADLIAAAEIEAHKLAIKELFVFSAIPKIYKRLGWSVVKSVEGSEVLRKFLLD